MSKAQAIGPLPSAQRIFVFGGSNSLLRGGWVEKLTARATGRFEVKNLSIGAATSVMGIYRLFTSDIRPGDIAVWEYGVNDQAYPKAPFGTLLIENLLWFLKLARGRGAHVIPVMMYSRAYGTLHAQDGTLSPYAREALKIFAHYDLPCFDFAAVFAKRFGLGASAKTALRALYSDRNHYQLDLPQLDELVDWVMDRAEALAPHGPADPLDVPLLRGRMLSHVQACNDNEGFPFHNSVVAGRYRTPGFEFTFGRHVYLKALIVLATEKSGGLAIAADGRGARDPYSISFLARPDRPKRQVKHLSIEFAHWPQRYPVRSQLHVYPLAAAERPRLQLGFRKPLHGGEPGSEEGGGVIAAIVEEVCLEAPITYLHRQPLRKRLRAALGRVKRKLLGL